METPGQHPAAVPDRAELSGLVRALSGFVPSLCPGWESAHAVGAQISAVGDASRVKVETFADLLMPGSQVAVRQIRTADGMSMVEMSS
ncbi:hypothetical protein GCM10011579_034180 [Streptomyces albiflavescens]|uniref:Uncharacterized protein n=1 Tax=Streptomyces albiflavescens TaxID=1623582 RepID=A0A917Y2V7_9ACTN|nr:hypothetical protein GCM10011579_034180 [Streptomyces albiflavescens]